MSEQTKKRMRKMLIILGILFGLVAIYKIVIALIIRHAMANYSQVVTVAVKQVQELPWQPKVTASGSLRAIQGVNVTTELAGMVQTIYFTPGANATQGEILVQLKADSDIAQLHSLEANAALAKITYDRDKAQFAIKGVSKATLDMDAANLQSLTAQVAQQAAIVNKKSIRAPFSGRLGIRNVNLGQFVSPGDSVVMLQTLNPIYADFFIPQQELTRLRVGLPVTITSQSFPKQVFTGTVTTINPGVDTNTRNVEVEATIDNPKLLLKPGMFVSVAVDTGAARQYLTVPQTAVSFNPYGDIVFVVKETGKDRDDKPILIANQRFVTTGATRGDQITILKGLKAGDTVVTSGSLKLKNGSQVTINNSIEPGDSANPDVKDE